jgi:hypothetical protein
MFAQQRAVGFRRRDQDSTQAAQRHEAAAAKTMRHRIPVAARCAGTARFGNKIVRSFFDFFWWRTTRQARAGCREHGGIHTVGCGACHRRQVAGSTSNSRATVFARSG